MVYKKGKIGREQNFLLCSFHPCISSLCEEHQEIGEQEKQNYIHNPEGQGDGFIGDEFIERFPGGA